MIREIFRRFRTPPPILIYCSEKHVGRYGDDATKAGASLVTAPPKDLMLKITETLTCERVPLALRGCQSS
jgi:hypothetical protein